ncbi:hypothetical protein [uncultured Bacteroides sp.]|uniref:hypothetical protein n=1 Tax=uncultured Bacteroides sp. TaxID=162156 RepID=UPI00280C31A6|nr:hypothetical protein [uncultured Bacteroides sp.]
MKKLLIYMVYIMAGTGAAGAQEMRQAIPQAQDSIRVHTVYVYDTIYIGRPAAEAARPDSSEIIYTKPVGRFDRGIINYRFIPKKKWVGGLTFSYINYDGEDSRMLFSLIKDFDCNFRTLSVKPFIGYAFKDNIVIGLKTGYNHTVADLGNISLSIDDDLSFDLKDIRYSEDSYSIALFHRSYVGLDKGKRFGFFNESSLSYTNGSSTFTRGRDETLKRTETTIHEIHLGLNPGVAVFIMENVCAEMSFGVVGFKYRIEKQKNNKGEVGKRNTSGADFKINLFNINIGITLCL